MKGIYIEKNKKRKICLIWLWSTQWSR